MKLIQRTISETKHKEESIKLSGLVAAIYHNGLHSSSLINSSQVQCIGYSLNQAKLLTAVFLALRFYVSKNLRLHSK